MLVVTPAHRVRVNPNPIKEGKNCVALTRTEFTNLLGILEALSSVTL